MRKLPKKLDNPFDNVIIDLLCEPMAQFFHKLHMTPNDITTLSLITGLLSVIFLYKGLPIISVVFYFFSYVFDCVDGFTLGSIKCALKKEIFMIMLKIGL